MLTNPMLTKSEESQLLENHDQKGEQNASKLDGFFKTKVSKMT